MEKRKGRPPRNPDNPMAVLAREVLTEAEQRFKKAHLLAAEMEPHVHRLYSNSAIYSYTNEHSVPPGDVLLAAALAAGISLDKKLGIGYQPTELERHVDELRTQLTQMQGQMAELQDRLADGEPRQTPEDEDAAKARRSAERREWARRSSAAPPAAQQGAPPRRTGRSRGIG